MAASLPASAFATEIIQASDYSVATSTEDTTEMFADLSREIAGESIVLLENKDNPTARRPATSIPARC